jgi:hypothetical protein
MSIRAPTQALLTDASNGFVTANTAITNAMLNVANDTAANPLTSVRTGSSGHHPFRAGGDL